MSPALSDWGDERDGQVVFYQVGFDRADPWRSVLPDGCRVHEAGLVDDRTRPGCDLWRGPLQVSPVCRALMGDHVPH